MAKWKSVIFSDIRNKLGDSIIFSAWKGRNYIRQYTVPANPNSVGQQGVRNLFRAAVTQWQTNLSLEPLTKTRWDTLGLSELISGFNKFLSEYVSSRIKVSATKTTAEEATITYTLGGIAASYRILAKKTGAVEFVEICSPGTLSAGDGQTIGHTFNDVGTYTLYLSNNDAGTGIDQADADPSSHGNKYDLNPATGALVLAYINVTAP